MTADVAFEAGAAGENYNIPLTEGPDNDVVDTAGYTGGTFYIMDLSMAANIKSITGTIPVVGTFQWAMDGTNTNLASANYAGLVELTGPGLNKKTDPFRVYVSPKQPV